MATVQIGETYIVSADTNAPGRWIIISHHQEHVISGSGLVQITPRQLVDLLKDAYLRGARDAMVDDFVVLSDIHRKQIIALRRQT